MIAVKYGRGFATKPLKSARERVDSLEAVAIHSEQIACPVRHHFAPGVYAREITIPKGTLLIGVVHKIDNIVILSAGRLQLATENGSVEISAPHTLLCKAGTKNAAVALEDAVWTNVFATEETDPEKLVEILTESTADQLLGGENNRQLAANRAALKGDATCHLQQ